MVRLFDPRSGEAKAVLKHEGKVMSAVYLPELEQVLSTSDDKTARLFDLEQGTELQKWPDVSSAVHDGKSGMIVFASPDGTLRFFAS